MAQSKAIYSWHPGELWGRESKTEPSGQMNTRWLPSLRLAFCILCSRHIQIGMWEPNAHVHLEPPWRKARDREKYLSKRSNLIWKRLTSTMIISKNKFSYFIWGIRNLPKRKIWLKKNRLYFIAHFSVDIWDLYYNCFQWDCFIFISICVFDYTSYTWIQFLCNDLTSLPSPWYPMFFSLLLFLFSF